MKKDNKSLKNMLFDGLVVLLIALGIIGFMAALPTQESTAEASINEEVIDFEYNFNSEFRDVEYPKYIYQDEGYDNFPDWWEAVKNTRTSYAGYTDSRLETLGEYISEEDTSALYAYEKIIVNSISLLEIQEYGDKMDEILSAAEEAKTIAETPVAVEPTPNNTYSSGVSNDFKSQGVVYQNGIRYTYYSSNVLYHYRTGEWTAGGDGFYRDSDGYLVVASDEYPQGSIVSTPWGSGKVYDCGAGPNTIDMYTNF